MSHFILFLCFVCSFSWAQHSEQPQKESTFDLRTQSVLFSIEIPQDKKMYLLERTANLDYFLRLKTKNNETIKKMAGREAQKLDRDFASRFLRCQYEIPSEKGDCKVTFRLLMKGERQDICQKDEKKTREFVAFVEALAQRF